MDTVFRCAGGAFEPRELRKYLFGLSFAYWLLIFAAWVAYPAENRYSIMTHTFSFLGSFETKHSPEHWWIFSIAMVLWGVGMIPMALHIRRAMGRVSRWAAWVGAFFLLMGGAGIALVGVFPDARGVVFAGLEWTEIHEKVAVLAFAGFFLAYLWHGVMLLLDAVFFRSLARVPGFSYRRVLWPYLFWTPILCVAVRYLAAWERIYAARRAAAQAAGTHIGSSWSEALGTRYSFPLWENVLIYSLFVFIVWFALALPCRGTEAGAAR
ncbi:MAG: DUF998 domain-containing protein [Candidatus Hydrogenedens sp.]|nr:DUF998 domain-containing protein [Candidatus Hydrogenedentota bacterium]NLF57088.1 DUF998 domain-containing protein [Candidatus Hydrogenedens sp.]